MVWSQIHKITERGKEALPSVNLGRKEQEEHSRGGRGGGRSAMWLSSGKGDGQTLNRQEAMPPGQHSNSRSKAQWWRRGERTRRHERERRGVCCLYDMIDVGNGLW